MHYFKKNSNIPRDIQAYAINYTISLWIIYVKTLHVASPCSHPMNFIPKKKSIYSVSYGLYMLLTTFSMSSNDSISSPHPKMLKKMDTSTHIFLRFWKFITLNIHFHIHISRILKRESIGWVHMFCKIWTILGEEGSIFVSKCPLGFEMPYGKNKNNLISPPIQEGAQSHKSLHLRIQVEIICHNWIPRFQIFILRIIHTHIWDFQNMQTHV